MFRLTQARTQKAVSINENCRFVRTNFRLNLVPLVLHRLRMDSLYGQRCRPMDRGLSYSLQLLPGPFRVPSKVALALTLLALLDTRQPADTICARCSALSVWVLYQLRQLRPLVQSMAMEGARTAAVAFISCRLDYCNSLLYQTWNWVIGSSFCTSGSSFWPGVRPDFFRFSKKTQDKDIIKRYIFLWKPVQPSLIYWHLINYLQNFTSR